MGQGHHLEILLEPNCLAFVPYEFFEDGSSVGHTVGDCIFVQSAWKLLKGGGLGSLPLRKPWPSPLVSASPTHMDIHTHSHEHIHVHAHVLTCMHTHVHTHAYTTSVRVPPSRTSSGTGLVLWLCCGVTRRGGAGTPLTASQLVQNGFRF